MDETITVKAIVNAPIDEVWKLYNAPEHVVKWNNASDDWHTPKAENDLRTGGKFLYRMEAKDGSTGFDFSGTYLEVEQNAFIEYEMDDGRKVSVTMEDHDGKTDVSVTFDPEHENSLEMQREGWQAILNNFKKYVESQE